MPRAGAGGGRGALGTRARRLGTRATLLRPGRGARGSAGPWRRARRRASRPKLLDPMRTAEHVPRAPTQARPDPGPDARMCGCSHRPDRSTPDQQSSPRTGTGKDGAPKHSSSAFMQAAAGPLSNADCVALAWFRADGGGENWVPGGVPLQLDWLCHERDGQRTVATEAPQCAHCARTSVPQAAR
jgi:hypothetical protein